MTQTSTNLKYSNNKWRNLIFRLSPFETFFNLQGKNLWKAQPNHDSSTATTGLKEKCYHSGQKISQPILSQKSLVTSQKICFLALITSILAKPAAYYRQPVLIQLFFQNFVSVKKLIMSEGCWIFILKMIKPASRNRNFSLRGSQPSIQTNCQYFGQK